MLFHGTIVNMNQTNIGELHVSSQLQDSDEGLKNFFLR